MPELPEVETVKRVLLKSVLNKKINKIDVFYSGIIKNDLNYFKSELENKTVLNILRRGKYLIFEFYRVYLIIHLRMEGKFFNLPKYYTPEKHDHVIFYFDEFLLVYNDVRKFGTMEVIKKDQFINYFKKLGLEPNDLTKKYLVEKLKLKRPIKSILLDQSIIAGIGNIYANEILFDAKINPFKPGCVLSEDEIEKVITSTKKIISDATKKGGTTIKSYTSSLNVKGSYQDYLCVHMKETCIKCGGKITKEKINNRSVYFCENCQR